MRVSEAALALITQINSQGETEYLTQWNQAWQAYSLIGGHLETGESFRECCVREIEEELHCTASDCELAPYPYATLRFREFSKTAREETEYHWQVFLARPSSELLARLPSDCAWVQSKHIRLGRTADGQSITEQVRKVLKAIDEAEFDLFVSYGHADDRDGSVTALVEHIRRDHEQFAPTEPLKIFFDILGIRDGDDWERRIYKGLIESKAMLAVLSPAYFASTWCRREYDTFVQQQMKKLYPGEPIHAIYIQAHPDFDATHDHPQRVWFEDVKRRQFTDAKAWWPDGQHALQRDVVASRLAELRETIWSRVCDAKAVQHSPSNLSDFNRNFVGREHELTQLWNRLRLDHAVAVSAIQGVGGLGKTALARAYAHSRRREYPGGQFEIAMEKIVTVAGLRFEIIHLANLYLGAGIPEELINSNLDLAFAKAKAAFERPGQGRILLILDNVATDGVLSERAASLPSSEFVHVLATTRLDPERWGIPSLRLESLSTADALDLFLKYRPFEIPDDDRQWHRVRSGHDQVSETEVDSDEWKAALGIVNRLGGHALAVEIVAVYLGNNRTITLQNYLRGLISKGLTLKLEQAGDDPMVRARLRESVETNISELLRPTFEKLEQECPLAVRALEWAALMPPDHVPWIWLRELIEQDHARELDHDSDDPDPWEDRIVPLLQGWQLLTSDAGPNARMHRIVQSAVRVRAQQMDFGPDTAGFLAYLVQRAISLKKNWGKPGVNWELFPLHFAAQQCSLQVRSRVVVLLVGHLITPLRLDGRLLPAVNLQQRVIGFLESLQSREFQDSAVLQDLSVSYCNMGDLVRRLGNEMQAREFYFSGLKVVEQLLADEPRNTDYAHALYVSNSRIGDTWLAEGKTTEGLAAHSLALRTIENLCSLSPENVSYSLDLSYAYIKVGDVAFESGDSQQALQLYEKALKIGEPLKSQSPENTTYERALLFTYQRIGDWFTTMGDSEEARRFFEKALEVSLLLLKEAPQNADCVRNLFVAQCRVADAWLAEGNTVASEKTLKSAIGLIEELCSIAPNNVDYRRDISMAYNKMGDQLMVTGRTAQARQSYEKALLIVESLSDGAPANARYARDLSVSCRKMGDCHLILGEAKQALEFYEKSIKAIRELTVKVGENAFYAKELYVTYIELGDRLVAMRKPRRARELFKRAVRASERLSAKYPKNVSICRDLCAAYERIARFEDETEEPIKALHWWRRVHDTMQGMVDRGLDVSRDDLDSLQKIKQILAEGQQ